MGNGPLNSLAQLELWRLELRFLSTAGADLAVGLIFAVSALGLDMAVGFYAVFGLLAMAFVGCLIAGIGRLFGDVSGADKALGDITKFNAEYDQRFRPEA